MGYVAVQGGKEAIRQANLLNEFERLISRRTINVKDIQVNMKPLVDQVMSESSLYDEELAALAVKQAGGSMEEAVFLLRAHRSTLPRLYYTEAIDTRDMFVKRRISASFKDIPGGQLLGNSNDFKQRFLDFDLMEESEETLTEKIEDLEKQMKESHIETDFEMNLTKLSKVVDYLAKHQLVFLANENNQEPDDITKHAIRFPSSRSEKLQTLTRGQTGAVTALGYAKIRQFAQHPNIGELRVGDLPLRIKATESDVTTKSDDDYYIGSIEQTEVESLFVHDYQDEEGQISQKLVLGYGLCYGQNETKAIAMSILDYALAYTVNHPTSDDEFVLYHIDTVESSGFISHLKLPHYVTFQSELDAIRQMEREGEENNVN